MQRLSRTLLSRLLSPCASRPLAETRTVTSGGSDGEERSEYYFQEYGKICRDDRCTYQEMDIMDALLPGENYRIMLDGC